MAGRRSRGSGSQFARYLGPILKALRDLGGSGSAREVKARVVSDLGLSLDEQREVTRSGQSLFANQFHWAKLYLTKAGLVESAARGVWCLTAEGAATALDPDERA